jgi:hypothetical protein
MSEFPSLLSGLTVTIDGAEEVSNFIQAMGRRAARAEILPIMLSAMAPVVADEKGTLGPHSKSGALEMSLKARTGSGDRPDTISVFSAPTATRKALKASWGRGRKQQKMWAENIDMGKRGRQSVFYGKFVELGHDLVRGGKVVKHVDPIHFALGAVPTLEEQAEVAAVKIAAQIVGG